MGSSFQYQGTLEETSLPEMLWTIYRHRVPGRIQLSLEGIVKQIYISEGIIIHASSTDRSDRLGAHLYRLGKLSRNDLAATMREREVTGKRHGELLIENGLLSPGELYEAIRSQIESIVWSVFSWQRGDLSFEIGEFNEPLTVRIHLPMRQAIVRGIKQAQDTKSMVAKLGKKSTVFGPTYGVEDLVEIALDAKEYELLVLVDGQRSLYEVCTAGPYGVSENARLLYAYHVLHLIERMSTEDGSPTRYRGD